MPDDSKLLDDHRLLRHSLRGTINALNLGVMALDVDLTRDETLEFLEYIIEAAEKMCVLLDKYEALDDVPAPLSSATAVGHASA